MNKRCWELKRTLINTVGGHGHIIEPARVGIAWQKQIPSHGLVCSCEVHWLKVLEVDPPK